MNIIRKSSETIRKTTYFNFNLFLENLSSHKKNISISFLEWFIGFVEGDGSFIISKNRLFFIINQKDIKTLYYIKKTLGFGKVSWYKTYGRFIVTDNINIYKLIILFNGNLLLNKTNVRFILWLDNYNINNPLKKINKCNKIELNFDSLIFNETTWLSGFISAEGCFNSLIIKNINYYYGYRFRIRFILDQKDEYEILYLIMKNIGYGRIEERKQILNYRFIIDSFIGCQQLIKYFNKFPLKHIVKKLAYEKWKKYLNFIISENFKKHKINIEKIIKLGNSINKLEEYVEDRVQFK